MSLQTYVSGFISTSSLLTFSFSNHILCNTILHGVPLRNIIIFIPIFNFKVFFVAFTL